MVISLFITEMHIIVFETAINLKNHCNNCHIIIGQLMVDSCDNLFITSFGSCDNIHYKQLILQTLPSTAFRFCAHSCYLSLSLPLSADITSVDWLYFSHPHKVIFGSCFLFHGQLQQQLLPFCSIAAIQLSSFPSTSGTPHFCYWSLQQLLSLPSKADSYTSLSKHALLAISAKHLSSTVWTIVLIIRYWHMK